MIFVGMDVSQACDDVAVHSGTAFQILYDERGIAHAVERLQVLQPTVIVLEATGGFEVSPTGALVAVGLPVVVINSRQVREFARATGQLAKTDAEPWTDAERLRAILARRRSAHSYAQPLPLPPSGGVSHLHFFSSVVRRLMTFLAPASDAMRVAASTALESSTTPRSVTTPSLTIT